MNSPASANKLPLHGCAPVPLASYLKALGILRLVSEQLPAANARGHWERNHFVFTSSLTSGQLVEFFLEKYAPTPVIAPWNGASGFFFREGKSTEKDPATGKLIKTGTRDKETAATKIVSDILTASSPRFAELTHCIREAKAILQESGFDEAPKEEEKAVLLHRLRNNFPDAYVPVLDAAFVLLDEDVKAPPLLGTGLNDGALDFSSNFMQRLTEVFDLPECNPSKESRSWIEHALFANTFAGLTDKAIGQFNPGASGGANSSIGFGSKAAVNPWEFVLMMEGAMLFAAAAVKRLESNTTGQLAYPFCVRQVGIGYGSAGRSDEEDSRCEMWLPLWAQPTGLAELRALLSEGRAQVNGRSARHGIDFARAVSSLGVDRGIQAFQRYGFQARNGRSYFATPLERVAVRPNKLATQLLAGIDGWLDQFRRAARSKAPSSAESAALRLESAISAFCKSSDPHRTQELLLALGNCERTLVRSLKWAREAFLKPVPLLDPKWISAANTGTAEFRLAAALAGLHGPLDKDWVNFRSHLEPVRIGKSGEQRWVDWTKNEPRDVVWHDGDLTSALNAVLARRLVRATQGDGLTDRAPISASLSDIAAFSEELTDDRLLADLLRGLSLVDFGSSDVVNHRPEWPEERRAPSASYALLKLCFAGAKVRDVEIPLVPSIFRLAAAGRGREAFEQAARRLTACGLSPAIRSANVSGRVAQRAAAALIFPIGSPEPLARQVLLSPEPELNLAIQDTL